MKTKIIKYQYYTMYTKQSLHFSSIYRYINVMNGQVKLKRSSEYYN